VGNRGSESLSQNESAPVSERACLPHTLPAETDLGKSKFTATVLGLVAMALPRHRASRQRRTTN
jgi:hypothetical protein